MPLEVGVLKLSGPASSKQPPTHATAARPLQVEIVARCCRVWLDEDTLDPEAVRLAETIMRAGMTMMPNSPYMIVLYSSFLM